MIKVNLINAFIQNMLSFLINHFEIVINLIQINNFSKYFEYAKSEKKVK